MVILPYNLPIYARRNLDHVRQVKKFINHWQRLLFIISSNVSSELAQTMGIWLLQLIALKTVSSHFHRFAGPCNAI